MRGIIYYNSGNKRKAENKLKEIIVQKTATGVVIQKLFGNIRAIFSDGEDWMIASVNENRKGFRWEKAFMDIDIPIEFVEDKLKREASVYEHNGKWYQYGYEWF